MWFNPLNTELNPICHLLALLGAPHILNICRIRVKLFLKLVILYWLTLAWNRDSANFKLALLETSSMCVHMYACMYGWMGG
jgi:transposase